MARFINIPALEIGRKGKWVLSGALIYQSDLLKKEIVVPIGFETDLASIPRIFTPLIPKNGKHRAPAIVHDWLWRETFVLPSLADKIFLEAMKVANVSAWRRYTMYHAVRATVLWKK